MIHDTSKLTHEHFLSLTTGTFRSRFYACLDLIGVKEVVLRASVGIDPTLLPEVAPNQPLTPFINVKEFQPGDFYQPFVRELLCEPRLADGFKLFQDQRLRDRLVDPAADHSVVAYCGGKAVFDIIWRQAICPLVHVVGRTYDVTPSGSFERHGDPLTVDVPDRERPTSADENIESFEMPVLLAIDYWQKRLPEEFHNQLLMRSMTHKDDCFTKKYVDRYPGHWR